MLFLVFLLLGFSMEIIMVMTPSDILYDLPVDYKELLGDKLLKSAELYSEGQRSNNLCNAY